MAWAPEHLFEEAPHFEEEAPQFRPPARLALARGNLADYAAAPPMQVLRQLESTWHGLAEGEAQARLARLGDNAIVTGRMPRWGARVLAALRNPFIVILIFLAAVSAITGDLDGAALITAMAVISCLLRVRQEYRSDRAAAALRAMVATTATVIRRAADGCPGVARELPVDQLVPGDVVELLAGDMVPADLRLLRSDDLAVSQAVFTGESLPVAKRAAPAVVTGVPAAGDAGACGFESPLLCFMGASVVSGSGTAVVVATGASTYLGCTGMAPSGRAAETSFDRGTRSVSWLLVSFMLVFVPVVLAVSAAVRGQPLEAFLFAIAVAVGLTPEMLPVVVTTALARGATVIARQAAIVKRLPAIHNLGAMDVLCTDKTGTLTQDLVSVDCFVNPLGRPDPQVLRLACVNSYLSAQAASPAITDQLDQALLTRAADLGLTPGDDEALIDLLPFDATRRRVTVITRIAGALGRHTLITKGSAEEVLGCCAYYRTDGTDAPLDDAERSLLFERSQQYARDGVRLLAVALATRHARSGAYRHADETGLTLIGFIGFRDPPRCSARAALAGLAGQGITVKVVTGDHPLVAARVCREVGIRAGQVVTGCDIDRLDDAALSAAAQTATVFARVDPAQKARIVRALRAGGHTVGFLADGFNDIAALREADVGISVDSAVAVARESADVILLRKDLTILGQAVTEGRRTFANIVKYLKITVSSNFGNALSMLAASAFLPFLPLLPMQVLAQNLCFDASQLALAFDTVDPSSLRRPRSFDRRDLARFVVCLGPVNTLADLATFVILWRIMGPHGSAASQVLFRAGWFAENLVTQAAAVHLLRSRSRPSIRHRAARPVLLATLALALTGVCLPFSPLGSALHLHPLPAVYFPLLAAVLVGYCAATIAVKALYISRTSRWL